MPPWKEKRQKTALIVSLMCVEREKVIEMEGGSKAVWAGGVLKAAHKNAGTPPIEAEFNRCRDVIEAPLTAKRKTAFQLFPFRHTGHVW